MSNFSYIHGAGCNFSPTYRNYRKTGVYGAGCATFYERSSERNALLLQLFWGGLVEGHRGAKFSRFFSKIHCRNSWCELFICECGIAKPIMLCRLSRCRPNFSKHQKFPKFRGFRNPKNNGPIFESTTKILRKRFRKLWKFEIFRSGLPSHGGKLLYRTPYVDYINGVISLRLRKDDDSIKLQFRNGSNGFFY